MVVGRSIGEGPGESCVRKNAAKARTVSKEGKFSSEGVKEDEEVAAIVDALLGGHVLNRCFTLARRSSANSRGVMISKKTLNDCAESKLTEVDAPLEDSGPGGVIDVGSTIEETSGGDSKSSKSVSHHHR